MMARSKLQMPGISRGRGEYREKDRTEEDEKVDEGIRREAEPKDDGKRLKLRAQLRHKEERGGQGSEHGRSGGAGSRENKEKCEQMNR